MMRLLPLLTVVAHAARTVKWEVKTTASKPAPASFDKWFSNSKNPVERAIVAANDAISEVNDLGGGNYEGRISGATFPLVKLQPVAGPSRRGAFLRVDRRGDGVASTPSRRRAVAAMACRRRLHPLHAIDAPLSRRSWSSP